MAKQNKTVDEKIAQKREAIQKSQQRMKQEQAKIAKLQKEIAELETFEIHTTIKDLNLPVSEVRSLLSEMAARRNTAASHNAAEIES